MCYASCVRGIFAFRLSASIDMGCRYYFGFVFPEPIICNYIFFSPPFPSSFPFFLKLKKCDAIMALLSVDFHHSHIFRAPQMSTCSPSASLSSPCHSQYTTFINLHNYSPHTICTTTVFSTTKPHTCHPCSSSALRLFRKCASSR